MSLDPYFRIPRTPASACILHGSTFPHLLEFLYKVSVDVLVVVLLTEPRDSGACVLGGKPVIVLRCVDMRYIGNDDSLQTACQQAHKAPTKPAAYTAVTTHLFLCRAIEVLVGADCAVVESRGAALGARDHEELRGLEASDSLVALFGKEDLANAGSVVQIAAVGYRPKRKPGLYYSRRSVAWQRSFDRLVGCRGASRQRQAYE